MPTPPPIPTEAQRRDIARAEEALDRLYPAWRSPPEERRHAGGFAHLTPEQQAEVKHALKLRAVRLACRDDGVQIVWSGSRPFAHAVPAATPTVNPYALRDAMNDPEVAALLRARGIVQGGER